MTLVFSSFCLDILHYAALIIAVLPPFGGVCVNILPNVPVIGVIADDVVVISSLPYGKTTGHRNITFQKTYHHWDGFRRGRCPHRPVPLWRDPKYNINVIWHDHIFVYRWNDYDGIVNNFSDF